MQIVHSDGDGIPDHLEKQLGTDPEHFDTDRDGLSDFYELVVAPQRAGVSGQVMRPPAGGGVAYAAEDTATAAWKTIDVSRPYDSNGDGTHEALDPYGKNVEVTLTSQVVGRVHSAISKGEGWDWKTKVPNAESYNDAFVALMVDEARTPAPLVADGQRVVPPDLSDPLTESKATAAWAGRTYEAKIPVWKLDDPDHGGDEDGIPTGYETYGYSWDGSKFEPWGFVVAGNSSYTPPTVGFEVVGTTLTPKKQEDMDYSVQYFKTDHAQLSSDADPYSDKLESTHSNIPQTVKAPSDRPVVAAYPTIIGYMGSANVTIKSEITTAKGKKVTTGSSSGSIGPGSLLPKVPIVGFAMGKARPSTGGSANGLDFVDDEAAVGTAFGAMAGKPTTGVKYPTLQINSKFKMTTEDWSQATTVKTDQAALLDFDVVLTNTGFANASQVQPTLDIVIGEDVVRSVQPAQAIDELPAQGTHKIHVNDVMLSLEQLKSYQSGVPVALRVNQVEAEVMIPQRDGDTITYKDAGKWSPFSSAIDNWCARITVDMGDGTFASYPVMARVTDGKPTTLLDALVWSLGVYENGKYQGLNVPGFLPDKGSAQDVPSFSDWMFCFDKNYSEADLAKYKSVFDIPLVPGSHVYVRSPMAGGDRPVVPWATISSTSGRADDVTNEDSKKVTAAVDAEMAVGSVWIAPSAEADEKQWTPLTDPDADGIYTATLPAEWRVIAGKPVVVAQNVARWGDGQEEVVTVKVPAETTGFTGLTGVLSAEIKKFPKDDVGTSRQIVCFDLDAPKAQVADHDAWKSPPSGTDLSMWLYSKVSQHLVPPGDVIRTVDYYGFAEAYGTKSEPKWMGKDADWATKSSDKSVVAMDKAKSKRAWEKLSGGIREQALGNAELLEKGDTILLETGDGHWAKVTITKISYAKKHVSGAGDAYTLKSVSARYTTYDSGQYKK